MAKKKSTKKKPKVTFSVQDKVLVDSKEGVITAINPEMGWHSVVFYNDKGEPTKNVIVQAEELELIK